MSDDNQPTAVGRAGGTGLILGLFSALVLFVASGVVMYLNARALREDAAMIAHTHEVLSALDDIVSLSTDAETGQRGYLITGDERYLDPYRAALDRIDERIDDVERLTQDNPDHQSDIPTLRARIDAKLKQLELAIAIRRDEGFDAARAAIRSDRGRLAMVAIRDLIAAMQERERDLRRGRISEMDHAYRVTVFNGVLASILGAALSAIVAYLLWINLGNRRRQDWLQAGQIRLGRVMAGDQSLEQLTDNTLRFLADYLKAHAGAFFVQEPGSFRRVATYGVPATAAVPERFFPNDGLLAQAAKDGETISIADVPDGYLALGSAFGQTKPRHLIIVPTKADDTVNAVLELGFVHSIDKPVVELFSRVSELIGVAIQSVNYRSHLQSLLEKTQRQAEELQAQGEELRVSNEELEEQSRALRESQSRLENQQAELEQTNSQLEEQSQLLESQRNDLSRANDALETKATELERASQYKSDFLANMSHELRTPLNSALILAKLLADNPAGNLSAEQVQYAETIQTAGNDLLTLINDILDLSKIEAGHMEVRAEPIVLARFVDDLKRTFAPVAEHKGLTFRVDIRPGTPELIESDRQRLEQVLKNLLSNAIKFTLDGEVAVVIGRSGDNRLGFAVSDTGIGIPADQQKIVFDAFRQADGTTNRKFGGTGLGLSISRELVRLLAGKIELESEPGRGSTFTVTIPLTYDPSLVVRSTGAQAPLSPAAHALSTSFQPPIRLRGPDHLAAEQDAVSAVPRRIADDRERLTGDRRVILIVEDDESFALILIDLTHELDFQCVVAMSAEEAVAVAVQYMPSAVVLDIGLPDHTGLWVLDRLKHDRRTRHIPVHVISANDYAQTALSLGAVGHMLKPVNRHELAEALKHLETRLEQRLRKVLVVEDDLVQLDSLKKLLRSRDVETVGVSTAAECLEKLKHATFDCMVLDLSLPDTSGYTLLETLSREDAYSFPPVIVYTGRELSSDEEQRLRRYSKSIIIKGARSPERLLDEVTLFLHQVVADLPPEQQRLLEIARSRDAAIEGRRILIVEDDVRNVFALTSILESRGATIRIARNGREAIETLDQQATDSGPKTDLVLMDVMMPEVDGLTAVREIRKRPEWKKLPIIMLTAKAMRDDQEQCLDAGANDYMAKPLDVEKLLSLVRVWMPR